MKGSKTTSLWWLDGWFITCFTHILPKKTGMFSIKWRFWMVNVQLEVSWNRASPIYGNLQDSRITGVRIDVPMFHRKPNYKGDIEILQQIWLWNGDVQNLQLSGHQSQALLNVAICLGVILPHSPSPHVRLRTAFTSRCIWLPTWSQKFAERTARCQFDIKDIKDIERFPKR